MLRLEGCHVFNRSSAGCESVGALHLALSSSVPFVSRQSWFHNAVPLCADFYCVFAATYTYIRDNQRVSRQSF